MIWETIICIPNPELLFAEEKRNQNDCVDTKMLLMHADLLVAVAIVDVDYFCCSFLAVVSCHVYTCIFHTAHDMSSSCSECHSIDIAYNNIWY